MMRIDLSLLVSQKLAKDAQTNLDKALFGHLGTHFDVMNKKFPLEYLERDGIVFDVSGVQERDIDLMDINLSLVGAGMFVAVYTGFMNREPYGTKRYFASTRN